MSDFGPVESLGTHHELDAFDCGSEAQSIWLRRYALQAHRSGTARVYIVCLKGTNHVVGYYALASGSVATSNAPARVTKGTGRYPDPVVLPTRLGVDHGRKGRGLGTALVRDALFQVLLIAEIVGVRALLIHAETPRAAAFYRAVCPGFAPSPTDPLHLTLLLKDLPATLGVSFKKRFAVDHLEPAIEVREPRADIARVMEAVRAAREEMGRSGAD